VGAQQIVGTIQALWRYPVKSMHGETLQTSVVGRRGLLGDRAYGLIDRADGKVASAKNPRKWPRLLEFSAAYQEPLLHGFSEPIRVTLPDGQAVASGTPGCDAMLSAALGRDVMLKGEAPDDARFEIYTPILADVSAEECMDEIDMPPGSFFDIAPVHVLTTASLERLQELYPAGRFEVERFRPNLVIETQTGQSGFIENDWIGRTVYVGEEVALRIRSPCGRCVMTTLPQGRLPHDGGILRTVARHNRAAVGVYADVVQGGTVACGDPVRLGKRRNSTATNCVGNLQRRHLFSVV
jgi:uncharacterized protein